MKELKIQQQVNGKISIHLLKKGIEVTITGDIYEETWTTDAGEKRNSYEVRANTLAITPFGISKLNLVSKAQFPDKERYAEVPF